MNAPVLIDQADGGRPERPQAMDVPGGAEGETAERNWAVCCSGGGIRSASFCLGALQALEHGGLLRRTGWIFGVSGGSYAAAARALVAHHLGDGAGAISTAAAPGDQPARAGQQAAYAPGTQEERALRNNTHYMAPSAGVVLAGILSLLVGVAMTFVLVFAPLYAFAHAWGWLLRWQDVLSPSGQHGLAVSVQAWMWILPAAAGAATFALFVWWWVTLLPRGPGHIPDRGPAKASWVGWGVVVTAVLAVMTLGVPFVAAWLFTSHGVFGDIVHFFGFGEGISWTPAALGGLIAAVAAVAKAGQAGLAKWQKAGLQGGGGLLSRAGTWLRQRLLPWLGSAAVVLVAMACAVLWIGDGAKAGFTLAQLWPVLIALGVMLLARMAADVNRMSLHDFYRWRLASAYAVTRPTSAGDADTAPAAAPAGAQPASSAPEASIDQGALLSGLAGQKPELVVCATANINAARETPPGQEGFCLTFDPAEVILHRETGSTAEKRAAAATADYEALVGQRRLTLFDISAISGAAFSPLMGAATRQAYRILFTVANLRLGVWLPHPRVVRDARTQMGRDALSRTAGDGSKQSTGQEEKDSWWTHHPLLLLLWYLTPHPYWNKNKDRNEERERKLWAHVLKLRLHGRGTLWYWAMQPALGLLWAEAAGHTSYRSTWIYASDGGHYDNLGLVEALRRGAEHVIVLDASGDKAGTWFTLGGAIALARADEGVEINLDPSTMINPDGGENYKLHHGEVFRPWAYGTFTRRGGSSQLPAKGEIWVCKLGWWRKAPWDVRAYAARHPEYPGESTAEQLYDGAEFEAYRELGAATVLDAAQHGKLPLPGATAPAHG
jgi:hypothetical protein